MTGVDQGALGSDGQIAAGVDVQGAAVGEGATVEGQIAPLGLISSVPLASTVRLPPDWMRVPVSVRVAPGSTVMLPPESRVTVPPESMEPKALLSMVKAP